MRQHESSFAAEHLKMMATRTGLLETKVTMATHVSTAADVLV